METSGSSSAWCCSARCWPGICVSSSSSFYLWMSARSVLIRDITSLSVRFKRRYKNLNTVCFFVLSLQTIYKQCKIDHGDHASVPTVSLLPSNHTTPNTSVTPTKRLVYNMYLMAEAAFTRADGTHLFSVFIYNWIFFLLKNLQITEKVPEMMQITVCPTQK